ncbi:GAD-like domain-containing protein [Agrobacterium tumefaciens]|uniref:GAD-like domain-containing protein n=1 Tax=Agrobacterium tumefaciens TaxID=358 RepID=UPI000975C1D7|nr:hypothetical protein BV900_15110 [Agrobacterium tumefaciens]
MTVLDYYSEIVRRFGTPQCAHPALPREIGSFRGHLPPGLLKFWSSFGWGSFGANTVWMCNPNLLRPVVNEIFRNDAMLSARDLNAIAYEAFGNVVYLWHPRYKIIWLDMMFGDVIVPALRTNAGGEAEHMDDDDTVAGRGIYQIISQPNEWFDVMGQRLPEAASLKLGRLIPGEAFGFVQPIQLGGANRLENVRRLPILDYLQALIPLQTFNLICGAGGVDVDGQMAPVRALPGGNQQFEGAGDHVSLAETNGQSPP